MSIHATFFDTVPYRYKPYPDDEMEKAGYVYFCRALATDYVRVTVEEEDDPKRCARVDLDLQQLRELRDALNRVLQEEGV